MSTPCAAESNVPVAEVTTESALSTQERNVLLGLYDSTSTASKVYLLSVARSLAIEDTVAALSAGHAAPKRHYG